MIVAGVMSGTSADGIDVALVRLLGRGFNTRMQFLAHAHFSYPANVRRKVLESMNARAVSVADLARLDFLLAELYAKAVKVAARKHHLEPELVGCHGQTLYHQGNAAPFLGTNIATTWQAGDGSVLAARLQVPVVSDFRPADMAAGGVGAPLVPFFDFLLYRDRRAGRVVQNIGGIANLTAIPAGAKTEEVMAFDTGPGNMVIDASMQRLFHREYDRDGRVAAAGKASEEVVRTILSQRFFQQAPPRTAGREEFGEAFVGQFLRMCGRINKQDIIATATALTARTIADALLRFVVKKTAYRDFIVSGGGVYNATLVAMLQQELKPLGLRMRTTDKLGLPASAKEAAAFAVLAYQTWHRQPSNIPSATGARHAAILGKISYV